MTTAAELAGRYGLTKMGARPPLLTYLRDAWSRRAFVLALSRFRVEAKHSTTRLGLIWVVFRPILTALVYGFAFTLILRSDTRPPNFIPFLVVGVFTFEYFSRCFSDGAKAITSNQSLVSSLGFPRIALPVSVVLRHLFEVVPVMLTLLVIITCFGEWPRWTWFMMIPVLVLMTIFNVGVALIAARLTVQFADTSQLIPFITRLLFYVSGVFFSLELVLADNPDLLRLAQLNPVHDFMALMRGYLIEAPDPGWYAWAVVGGWSLVAILAGTLFFWQAEERYGRD